MRQFSKRPVMPGPKGPVVAYRPALAALADPTRWAVFERTLGGSRPVRDIAWQLPVSRAAVSHHLKALKDAGLVTCRRDGRRRLYRAGPWAIAELVSFVDTLWREAMAPRAMNRSEGGTR